MILVRSEVCPKCKGLGRSWVTCSDCDNTGFQRVYQMELEEMPAYDLKRVAELEALRMAQEGHSEPRLEWPSIFTCPQCHKRTQPAWLGAIYCWECQPYHVDGYMGDGWHTD